MVQIAGKYQVTKNEKLVEYLVGLGQPEDKAKERAADKYFVEFAIEGKNLSIKVDRPVEHTAKFVLDKEVDDVLPSGVTLKSTATVSGDAITIVSKLPSGGSANRTYKFSDSEVILTLNNTKPAGIEAKIYYKRV